MPLYRIYKQQPPRTTQYWGPNMSGNGNTNEELCIIKVGELEAPNGSEAIDRAKELPVFKYASKDTLGAYPIVMKVSLDRSYH